MAAFTTLLLQWFAANERDLPWRATKDAYAIWLSEIILQQTRVQQGTDYWLRFLRRWPTIECLAQASEDEVMREWQGLGYYSRARHLHQTAKIIVQQGVFPSSFEQIRMLPGIGNYTAAAISSIAFGLPVAAIDGNAYRVLSRYFAIDTPINTAYAKREFAALAQSLLPTDNPSAFNQAMMDFGSLQCVPKSPSCTTCPLAESCQAFRQNAVENYPVKSRTINSLRRNLIYIFVHNKGGLLLRRRETNDIWKKLWEPVLAYDHTEGAEASGCSDIYAQYGTLGELTLLAKDMRHVLSHRIIYADFYRLETEKATHLFNGYQWVSDISQYALPRLIEKMVAAGKY